MDTENATSPVGGEDTAPATLDTETEVETQEQEQPEQLFDDDGNPIEEPDEDEEVELDEDLKLKVPKTQAQRVRDAMLRQADYTRKTQELADQRKVFEEQRQTLGQATNEELTLFADAKTLGQRLASYQNVDWNAWNAKATADYDIEEQARVQAAWMDYQQTKDRHANAVGQLRHMEAERRSQTQQETAKRIEEGRAVLTKDIGWNDGTKAKLTDYALERGLSRDDLSDLEATPAAAKILHDAYQWSEHQKKTQAAKRHETAQQVQPAATVGAKRAPPSLLDDRMGTEAWMKRRDAQTRKRA